MKRTFNELMNKVTGFSALVDAYRQATKDYDDALDRYYGDESHIATKEESKLTDKLYDTLWDISDKITDVMIDYDFDGSQMDKVWDKIGRSDWL